MDFVYNVPIIPQDLRRDETMVQIADSLKYLSEVSNDIFTKVNNRIETNRSLLYNLSKRIDEARLKVSKLSGTTKATRVFSSSKYPATDIHRQYKSVFEPDINLSFTRSKLVFKDIQTKGDALEPLQFYHVKTGQPDDVKSVNGLGAVSKDIIWINDLLLYNSGKNPYQKYQMADPLQPSFKSSKDDTYKISDIGDAPYSISERTSLSRLTNDSFFYSPDLGNVPLLDVPLDLPDLPGVADDLRYVNDLGPGIAPSIRVTNDTSELPTLEELVESDVIEDKTIFTNILLPPLTPPPPPPHPPPPPPFIPIPTNQVTVPQKVASNLIIQAAPESLMIPSGVQPLPQQSMEPAESRIPSIAMTDAHANLMEAIRRAGGSENAKLKAREVKQSTALTGDLMADLHLKLSLRRKGISGSKMEETQSGLGAGSAMKKVSAMIPPPPASHEAESINTEDDDWDE